MVLNALFFPQSIALIGASRTPGKVGHEILSNLIEGGYQGQIVPVNPSATEVLGTKCYSTLDDFRGRIDLGLIAVPAPSVVDATRSSIKAGAKAVAVLTAGFAEIGHQGKSLQTEILTLCSEAGVRLLGPNCLGLINTSHHMNASFSRRLPQAGNISVISESGALCTAMLDWAASRNLGLAKIVSIGNKADLDEVDILEAFATDEQTHVVVGYLESISSGEKFVKAALTLTSNKPFILLKAGVTKAGIWAASAHTGNLAGADLACTAAFKRTGVIRAESLDALFDYAAALSMQPLPQGDRVAIITNAGGPAVMAADAVEQSGLRLAKLDSQSMEALREELPPAVSVYNPIDVLGDANPQRYATAVSSAQQDAATDSVIVILTPHAMTKPNETMQEIAAQTNRDKPVLVVFLGIAETTHEHRQWTDYHLPIYPSPERAVAALRGMYEYRQWRNQPERIVTRFPVNRHRVERIISRHIKTKQTLIGEVETKEILRAYDFGVPEGQVANTAEEAVEIAEHIGFPVALKIVSLDILHKSDVGGIKLGISNGDQVRDTFDLLTLRVGRRAPQAQLTGIYVEKMCIQGLHVVMGVTTDPRFGPILMFGLGGTYVDRLESLAYHLVPITADEAMHMLSETRSYALLTATRGQPDIDISTITGGLQRISQLATDFPQIKELNINPYIVGRPGSGAMVVDARITLS